ncbi:MAG: tyrosine-type recombinase/integrase [Bacteroidota bacterium]
MRKRYPISDKLYDLLNEKRNKTKSHYVFPFTNNNKLSERTLLSNCKRIAKDAGINKNATLHLFRHSFNSHLAQKEVDYTMRQYLIGHKPRTITDYYTKIDPKLLHSKVNLLEDLLPNN